MQCFFVRINYHDQLPIFSAPRSCLFVLIYGSSEYSLDNKLKIEFKVDRLQIIVVAKNITVLQLFISRMPKMCAIPQLVSAPLNPIPTVEHFRRSHSQCEHSNGLTDLRGAIHSTKIPIGPTGKRGPPQKVDPFFRNFSGWTEPIH